MTYERLPYDDQDTTVKMHVDCTACATEMRLPGPSVTPDLLTEVPPLTYDEFPREVRKPEITISDAAAHLASRLHLHLD
jgi:hypothetical protein